MPDLTPFARCGTAETTEMPVVELPSPYGAPEGGAGGGSWQRRVISGLRCGLPGNAMLAGVGVAAVLGAGLITVDLLSGDQSGGDVRSISTENRALGIRSGEGVVHTPSAGRRELSDSSVTAEPTAQPGKESAGATRADRNRGVHTAPSSHAPNRSPGSPDTVETKDRGAKWRGPRSGSGKARAGSAAGAHGADIANRAGDAGRSGAKGGKRGAASGARTLRMGDSGAEVRELQRRLKEAGYLDKRAREDGRYSIAVQNTVFRYQTVNGVEGDVRGEYGPETRSALEAVTSG
jgi:hypothetical protein